MIQTFLPECFAKQKYFKSEKNLPNFPSKNFFVIATLQTFVGTYSEMPNRNLSKKTTEPSTSFQNKFNLDLQNNSIKFYINSSNHYRHRARQKLEIYKKNEGARRIWQLYNHCSGGFIQSALGFVNAKGRSFDNCLSKLQSFDFCSFFFKFY